MLGLYIHLCELACPGQISIQAIGTTNSQSSLGAIRFFLNRAGPEVHSEKDSARLAASCSHALTEHLRNRPVGLSEQEKQTPYLQGHVTSVCLFVCLDEKVKEPAEQPPLLINYLPNV